MRYALLLIGALAVLAACGNDPFDPGSLPNQRPVARLFVTGDSLQATSYNQRSFFWSGSDIDGEIVGFHVSIAQNGVPPTAWIYTTKDDSTATYQTDGNGRAEPRVFVVAQDDRGALSDTVSASYPLVNFPPVLEWQTDFKPLLQSFGAASFLLRCFDRDGNETLNPYVEYRFAGSDSNLIQLEGDPGADPALGWYRVATDPTKFSLALTEIPAGDEAEGFLQRLYIRTTDEAGASAVLVQEWVNFEAVGDLLLMDDDPSSLSRDEFWKDSLDLILPGNYSRWDISAGLPERDADLRLTLEQFRMIAWYTGNGPSANLRRAELILQDWLRDDLDPDVEGIQAGRLLVVNTALVGGGSNLSSSFRSGTLGLELTTDPRNPLLTYNAQLQSQIGNVEINSQHPDLRSLESNGENYLGGSGRFFGLEGFKLLSSAAPLWRFEPHTWGGSGDPTCRLGCEPVVAARRPADGTAAVISVGFQLEYSNFLGNASGAVEDLLVMLGLNLITGEVD